MHHLRQGIFAEGAPGADLRGGVQQGAKEANGEGAPNGSTCSYCGTRYSGNNVQACFGEGQVAGTLTVGGEEFEVYLQSVEIKRYVADGERDWRGRMHRSLGRTRRRFVLVET